MKVVLRLAVALGAMGGAAACDAPPSQSSATESLEKYTEGNTPLQSREQVRHYAEVEGRMHKIEKDVKELRERMRAGLAPSSEKLTALAGLDEGLKSARAKITEIRAAGSTTWEGLKPGVDAAVSEAETRHKKFVETP